MMKTTVNLSNFPYFSNPQYLEELNRHIKLHDDFMPHQISGAIGCSLKDALGILILLYFMALGELYLLVYHQDNLEVYIEKRKFSEGHPKIPFVNPLTDLTVNSLSELEYDIQFDLNDDVEIEFEFIQHDR
ncbi:MAG: hypothetical protein GY803_02930 [Chloroflexi bacterium]|nr:hypothetical protein [Chloroflexota bacterium]